MDKNKQAFFVLLRAGLWEKEVHLTPYGEIDFSAVLDLAEEQSVVGLLAAGIEHVVDGRPAKKDVLQFIGRTVQLEQRNQAMNYFIGVIVEKMREAGIHTVLVKGQGVAQCYERPLWRSCGDVDFFLDDENYARAKEFLIPLASSVEREYLREKHLGMIIDSWVVELHGSLFSGLSSKIEKELSDVAVDTFYRGNVCSWMNDKVQVSRLSVENDLFYVFTHILQHFYKGGIGLRQICDWCRSLWHFRQVVDLEKLERRLVRAGLMTEWKAFGAVAVEYLGMDVTAVPFYSNATKWKKKAARISDFVIMSGNFGQSRDQSYYQKSPYVVRKVLSLKRRMGDLWAHARIFPWDSIRFMPAIVVNGVKSAMKGE